MFALWFSPPAAKGWANEALFAGDLVAIDMDLRAIGERCQARRESADDARLQTVFVSVKCHGLSRVASRRAVNGIIATHCCERLGAATV
jgi:hypothetical protein